MKKVFKVLFTLVASLFLALSLAACSKNEQPKSYSFAPVEEANFKIGVICLHGEESTYDKNFIDAIKSIVKAKYGNDWENHLEIKTGVAESSACLDAANELAKSCNVVFADSFGHEDYMIQAAAQNPTVRFCHATGTKAHTTNLANYSNAFASIYEGRYMAGYAAGLKLNLMKQEAEANNQTFTPKVGYIGAFPYAEVKSGYTSFFLGVRAAYEGTDAPTMVVRYTSSWYDYDAEYQAAKALVEQDGCVLISQHADSMGAPTLCKEKNVPNITYNIETKDTCAATYVSYSRINWAPYFEYIMNCSMTGVRIDADWTGTLETGSVEYAITDKTEVWGSAANYALVQAAMTVEYGKLVAGQQVFATDKFKVSGNVLTTYKADVNDWGDFQGETEVVLNGAFRESKFRSAPYFDLLIDGITEVSDNK